MAVSSVCSAGLTAEAVVNVATGATTVSGARPVDVRRSAKVVLRVGGEATPSLPVSVSLKQTLNHLVFWFSGRLWV